MIAFTEMSDFLKQYGSQPVVLQVEAFLRHFRTGKCYLHPFDNNGDHEFYFTSKEIKIDNLFVAGYQAIPGGVHSNISFLCFDGAPLHLVDVFSLLGHFLTYEEKFLAKQEIDLNLVEIDLPAKLADGKWIWVAFMVCEDHEGESAMAAYSKCLTPPEGLKMLHTMIHQQIIGPTE